MTRDAAETVLGGAAARPEAKDGLPAADTAVGTRDPGRLDEIDALRAIAMSAVVAEHCRILPFGWMGVWLFYVISGFVVTTSLVSRPAETPGALLYHFYARRMARILPIYLAYVTIGFLVSAASQGRFEWTPFLSLLFFFNNFQSAFANGVFKGFPVGHLWTISVEMQFYLVFGFAFALLSRRGLRLLLIGLVVLAPLLRWAGGVWLEKAGFSPLRAAFAIYTFSPMHFDSFAFGALLALASTSWRRPPRSLVLWGVGALCLALYFCAYVAVNRAHHLHGLQMFRNVISGILFGDGRQIWLYSAAGLCFVGVLATTLSGGAAWSMITRNRALQAVGRASYGGYVYHAFCLPQARALLRGVLHVAPTTQGKLEFGLAMFLLALPATIGLSLISYRYVERPIIASVGRRMMRPAISAA
jgi:peptidoglycan/LPS O-acetylase OafA/YrhL